MESGLYVVGTPIGNLGDVTHRAAETLQGVDTVYAEDTRRTGRLLKALEADPGLRSLHEHNEARRREEILERLRAGDRLAVVSDAGTPGVSDPGRRVVEGALEAGLRVVAVPGPSAVTAALSVSGLPADRFAFLGFPPRTGAEREAWMERVGRLDLTSVVFASPKRLDDLLAEWEDRGLGGRACVLCRELTKMHEEVRRSTVSELRERAAGEVRGEVTLVLEGAADAGRSIPREAVRTAARALAGAGWSTRDVTEHLERAYGVPRNEAYDLALDADGDGT